MAVVVESAMVEPVTRGLLGSIDVDGGPTDEQLAVLHAVVSHLWGRADLDFGALAPLDSLKVRRPRSRAPRRAAGSGR
jgi:hypothetical protein